MTKRRAVDVLGVPVDALTLDDAARTIAGYWERSDFCHVVTVNPEMVMAALEPTPDGKRWMNVLREAAVVVADGVGVVWGARLLGHALPERVPGVDLADRLLSMAAKTGRSVFLLGGEPGVAEEAARRLQQRHPGLVVAGAFHGYFDATGTDGDEGVAAVAARPADLLLVGMGAPFQDQWISRRKKALRAKVAMGVGGALDVFAGKVKRAPKGWQRAGLEWAYRLITQPSRARRMAALPRFAWAVARAKWRRKALRP